MLDREDEQRLEEYLIACEEGFMGLSRDAAGAVAAQMLAERNSSARHWGNPSRPLAPKMAFRGATGGKGFASGVRALLSAGRLA